MLRQFKYSGPFHTTWLVVIIMFTADCAPSPVLPAPFPTLEEKLGWILRLEDQRVLRDPAPLPSPVVTQAVSLPEVPDLTQLIDDPSVRLRYRAALAIGRVGLSKGVAPLVRALNSSEPEVRQISAFALGLIGDATAVEPLIEALNDVSPIVQGRAAEALGSIGDPVAAKAVGEMVASHVTAAYSVDPEDVSYPLQPEVEAFRLGLYALVRLEAYELIAEAVLDTNGEPILWWWPVTYALQELEDSRAIPALRSFVGVQGSYGVAFAAKGLGALGASETLDALLPLLNPRQRDSRVIVAAIQALTEIGDSVAEGEILQLLRIPELNEYVFLESIKALGIIGGTESTDILLDLIAHPKPAIRAAALGSLARLDPETFVIMLSSLDLDSHWSVRVALARALGFLDLDRALPRLTTMLGDADLRVIPAVLSTLYELRSPNTESVLLTQIGSPDAVVRMTAAKLLGQLKPEGLAHILVEAYKRGASDQSYIARAAALDALANYGAREARQTLQEALADPDWVVRVHAAARLDELESSGDYVSTIRPAPIRFSESAYAVRQLVNPTVSTQVFIETDKGTIQAELAVLDAPMTVDNFITLARRRFFDGLEFHQIGPDSLVRSGDPRGDSQGGPGYTIRDELNQIPNLRGTLGMVANSPDTGGSQFFIARAPQPDLDGRYTAFGRVIAGMEVVDQLQQGDVIRRVRVWDGSVMTSNDAQLELISEYETFQPCMLNLIIRRCT